MVSIVKTNVIKEELDGRIVIGELRGLSTDNKPTTIDNYEIGNGSAFIEIDTGDIFLYDYESKQWNEV